MLHVQFPSNRDAAHITIKALAINGLYNARLFGVQDMIQAIRREFGGRGFKPTLASVDKICQLEREGQIKHYKSFASKYFRFFVDAEEFPIYDQFTRRSLAIELGRDRRSKGDQFSCEDFVMDLLALRNRIGCSANWRELDRYLYIKGNLREFNKYAARQTAAPINTELQAIFKSDNPSIHEKLANIEEGFYLAQAHERKCAMDHIAIQNDKNVERRGHPDADLLCRLYKSKKAPYEWIRRGDVVYLKLSSQSEIKLKASIERFRFVEAVDVSIDEVREMTAGYRLYDDNEFWQEHRDFQYGTIIWLKDPEETGPYYPESRSHGGAWIVLDTEDKRNEWLCNTHGMKADVPG